MPPASDTVDYFHGDAVADPYRPLEDLDAPETVRWVQAERELTESILSEAASRGSIRRRVAELWDYPKAGTPMQRGATWFQMRNSGLQPQPVLYASEDPAGGGRALVDPNGMSPDGTIALSGVGVSDDGSLVAYALSDSGSDWMTWRVRDAATGADLADEVRWSKFSGAAWAPDGSGFWYGGVPRPPAGEELTAETRALRILFHRIGSDQRDDVTVFEAPDQPDWIPVASVTPGGGRLVVTVERGTGRETMVLVGDAADAAPALAPLNPPFEAQEAVVAALDGGGFLLHTDRGAERGRVVLAVPGEEPAAWREVVPEAHDTLLGAAYCGGRLVCHYLADARSALRVYDLEGRDLEGRLLYEVPLDGPVSVMPGMSGEAVEGRHDSPLAHYQVASFTRPGEIRSLDLDSGATAVLWRSESAFDGSRFVTEQVFVESDDGTAVPMFVTRPEVASPGEAPARVLLYGYGGFNVPVTPSFSATFAAWLDLGGILAVACLRGGGEYGREWHDAGRLGNKQNVFDDFCACARWLADSGWSSPSRIAMSGGSNGGLLVGACLTQRPSLFGAAVAEVGVFDMLRFDRFTIGWAWKSDYGDPADPEQYRWLRAYSPLHNVEAGACFPPTLIMTGDHDDRVVPAHSFKFVAALQNAQGCANPVLLRVSTSAGHGAGKPTAKLIDEAADRLAFLDLALGPA